MMSYRLENSIVTAKLPALPHLLEIVPKLHAYMITLFALLAKQLKIISDLINSYFFLILKMI
jgi:hypothetical protein